MSTQYSAVILVGLPFNEVFNSIKEYEEFDYGIHLSTEFEIIHPYYDADLEDSLVGLKLVGTSNYSYREIASEVETQKHRDLFKLLTGKTANVYLSTEGY